MKKWFKLGTTYLILSIFTIQSTYAVPVPNSMIRFCEKIDKISSILSAYTFIEWPVVGVPGITMGLSSRTSPIVDLCDYVQQLQQLDTMDAVFLTGQVLNKMTNEKWDHHLRFAESTWSLAQEAWDFDNGEFRKSALESESFHREVNSYANDSYYWYNKTFNGEEKELKTRAQRESDMREFSQAVYERSTLEESLSCPKPEGNTKYGEIYDSKIAPKVDDLEEEKEAVDFHYGKLLELGPYFMNNDEDNQVYAAKVQAMRYSGVTISPTQRKRSENSATFEKKKENEPAAEGSKQVTRYYQSFSARMNSDKFSEFKRAYENQWKSYVANRVIQNGFDGLLDSPGEAVNKEFYDIDYSCSEYMMKTKFKLDENDPNYGAKIDKKMADCNKKEANDTSKYENILTYYSEKLKSSLLRMKNLQAQVWTLESKLMGKNIVQVPQKSGKAASDFRQDKVICAESKKMSAASMMQLNNKLVAADSKINQQIAKDTMKARMIEENKRKQQVEYLRSNARKEQFAQKQHENAQKDQSSISTPMAVSSSTNTQN